MSLSGKIIDWNDTRGFGYVESEGRRIFLHFRDFAERRKVPEVGDKVTFVLGADRQGRPCAQLAVHIHEGRRLRPVYNHYDGRLRLVHFLILVFLLLPGFAVYRLMGSNAVLYAGGWTLAVSALTYQVYGTDKRQAQNKGRRESETWLHWLEFFGGWPGAFFAQRKLRHKSSKDSYQFVFWIIIGLHQFVAIDALRGWPFLRFVFHGLQKL